MDSSCRTRDAFLYFMALIYMFAFGSWYIQIPGLYGDNGLLPIKNDLSTGQNKAIESAFSEKPTILWLFLYNGLSHQISLELLCLIGTLLSFLCLLFQNLRILPVFGTLWFLYFSLFQVGQTFSWFQWDTLLLESGFLTILVSPSSPKQKYSSLQRLPFFLVKWLLFRLMFASGVVKLASNCPTWWGLTALNYHFETQCIPTPLAWWGHQLPQWFLKLSVVATYVIEMGLPFLFFAPVRRLRLIAVYGQVLLMFVIILTGNYNFFNLLTLVLCVSIVDDGHLRFFQSNRFTAKKEKRQHKTRFSTIKQYFSSFTTAFTCSIFAYFITKFFGLKLFKNGEVVHSKIAFTENQFNQWVDEYVVVAIWIGTICFICESIYSLYLCLRNKSFAQKIWNVLKYVSILTVCIYMFCISFVPLNQLSSTRSSWPVLHRWHEATDKYQIVHSYGLFRSMTGVGGRPEVIIEGSFKESGPWKEIPFLYKPGNTTGRLPWIIPHQPRLDWQMWFAALGQYQHNVWLLSLMDKVLSGEQTVLKLLDEETYPFKDGPPKYVRAELYHYRFTMLSKNGDIPKGVWRREHKKSYLPPVHENDEGFKKFLKYHKLNTRKDTRKTLQKSATENIITIIREYAEMLPIHILLWSLWLTAIVISLSRKYLRL